MKKTLIIFAVFLAITGVGCGNNDSGDSSLTYTLTVEPCNGTVTSEPAGINCGLAISEADCTYNFDSGTTVTLTATPATGYIFCGWSGDCSATGAEPGACAEGGTWDTCAVTMGAAKTCSATFCAQ